jgi:tetraprenyl-beta-curcumene synthase
VSVLGKPAIDPSAGPASAGPASVGPTSTGPTTTASASPATGSGARPSTGSRGRDKAALALTFTAAAARYWLSVYPHVLREARHWRGRAERIPDATLRRLALSTQRQEQGNLEGAAAFAVLAPRPQRACVVRAVVAFQAIYDYVDTLAEQPSVDPAENGRQLHRALLSALDPDTGHPSPGQAETIRPGTGRPDRYVHTDYYVHSLHKEDGGYLQGLIDACRTAFGALPSHTSLTAPALAAVQRIVTFQGLAHDGEDGLQDAWRAFSVWADAQTPQGSGLRWWETAAGAASSLLVLTLIATAAEPSVSEEEISAIARAYFPWIGALHLLLDSLIDKADDIRSDRYSLVDHYASPRELAVRLRAISAEAMRAAQALPNGRQHGLILAAMASFYLSHPQASAPDGAPARAEILAALGEWAAPAMCLFRLRGRRWRRRGSL